MPAVPITVPGVGESISEGILARWLKPAGSRVQAGEPLFELETDKASTVVPAPTSGVLAITAQEGETVAIGAEVGSLDPSGQPAAAEPKPAAQKAPEAKPDAPTKEEQPAPHADDGTRASGETPPLSPAVRRLAAEEKVDLSQVTPTGPGGRITKGDVLASISSPPPVAPPTTAPRADQSPRITSGTAPSSSSNGRETRQRMSGLRQRVAQRLLEAQQNAAILTTFNEADMSAVMSLRERFKEPFRTKHGVGLGFMSFFVKAVIEGLKAYPAVNARIDGNDIVYHNFHDIGVAVSTDRGLMVPVIRDADQLTFAGIEKAIATFAEKGRKGTITVDELQGGTFTITNGGIFGSLLSTPILNPPQSGILGMHAIKKRPVVVDDQIVIRPMMYLALSYDHRIIDGREAVSFLVRVKECIEDPDRMLLSL
jgi:2-oxoglutarate dehydrogenase E2 component (dihydrolipoamide succinyltransferase)